MRSDEWALTESLRITAEIVDQLMAMQRSPEGVTTASMDGLGRFVASELLRARGMEARQIAGELNAKFGHLPGLVNLSGALITRAKRLEAEGERIKSGSRSEERQLDSGAKDGAAGPVADAG
jgi:hypothetical protein